MMGSTDRGRRGPPGRCPVDSRASGSQEPKHEAPTAGRSNMKLETVGTSTLRQTFFEPKLAMPNIMSGRLEES